MRSYHQFYINGQWVDPVGGGTPYNVINPATEEVAGSIRMGGKEDVERAVQAANAAFASYSRSPLSLRKELLGAVIAEYQKRMDDIAAAVCEEMGAPLRNLARPLQAPIG